MRCNILQHMTTCCSTLQNTATHAKVSLVGAVMMKASNTLQCAATYRHTLQHTATYCNTLHMYHLGAVMKACNTLQHNEHATTQ